MLMVDEAYMEGHLEKAGIDLRCLFEIFFYEYWLICLHA